MDGMENIAELAESVMNADRRALSQAITLIESSRDDHRIQALELMDHLRSSDRKAIRVGLSGTPGVGKSTFIESFGTYLTGMGLRVAVLAVDPSSIRSGGSIRVIKPEWKGWRGNQALISDHLQVRPIWGA